MTNLGPFELDRVHLGDCVELMKQLPDKCVDCVVTDPPYGIGESNERNLSRGTLSQPRDYGHYEWDSERVSSEHISGLFRVSCNQVLFGGNYYTDMLSPTSCWIVWDKDNGSNDFADCELAWTSFDTAVRKFKWKWSGMLQEKMGRDKEQRYHPTQKPLALMKWIIEKYTSPDALILDPFSGSGTTGVAAIQLGRRFLGFEIDPRWVDLANKRIEAAKAQGVLSLD